MKLEIYRPIVSSRISQKFGENRACVKPNGVIFGTSTACPPGTRSFYESLGMKGHSGIDIPAWVGEEVYHAATFTGWWSSEVDSDGGLGVDVVSNEPLFFPTPIPTYLINTAVPKEIDGVAGFEHYVKMRYWHLKAPIGSNKKQVSVGTIIGLAGNTGASSGPHLHFAPKWCLQDGRGVGQANGYAGAFDPTPYYNHEFTAKEHAEFLSMDRIPLSDVEVKDMMAQLSLVQKLLNVIRS